MKVLDLSVVPTQERISDVIETHPDYSDIFVIEEYSETGELLAVNGVPIQKKAEHTYEPCYNENCNLCHCGRCAEDTSSQYAISLELGGGGLTISGVGDMLLDIEMLRKYSEAV